VKEAEKLRFRLAKHLGKSLTEIDSMPYREFLEWAEYEKQDPFNNTEIMLAQLTALMYNVNSKKTKSVIDFIVSFDEDTKKSIKMQEMQKTLFADIDKLKRNSNGNNN